MNPDLIIDIPLVDLPAVSSRSRKYITCLEMVRKILCRELNESISSECFNQIGLVAGFIDQHLDDLNINQQKTLLVHYSKLFETLWNQSHYLIFKQNVCNFVTEQKFEFVHDSLHLKDLYLFIQLCKKEEIKDELFLFGKTIIDAAINKHNCTTTTSLIAQLKIEGNAVLNLLDVLLRKRYDKTPEYRKTMSLLGDLEHIINLSDDILDVTSDKNRGLINKNIGRLHRLILVKHLSYQIAKTVFRHPSKTFYYAPILSFYYARETWF